MLCKNLDFWATRNGRFPPEPVIRQGRWYEGHAAQYERRGAVEPLKLADGERPAASSRPRGRLLPLPVAQTGRPRQKVLEALHRAAEMCRTRIAIVTAEVADLGFCALRGLSEATEAVAPYLTMLADAVKQPSAVMEPDHACLLGGYRSLRGLQLLWHKLTETQFFQRASLAADFPDALKE